MAKDKVESVKNLFGGLVNKVEEVLTTAATDTEQVLADTAEEADAETVAGTVESETVEVSDVGPTVEAVLLRDGALGEAGAIVNVPEQHVEAYQFQGAIDTHPDAIAYAKSQLKD